MDTQLVRVVLDRSFTCDTLYRMTMAMGCECGRPMGGLMWDPSSLSSDPIKIREYAQYPTYDEVGNMREFQHVATVTTSTTASSKKRKTIS